MIRLCKAIGRISLAVIVTTPIPALSYPWPFNHATSEQQVVRQTLGSYRTGNRLHNGVGIQPGKGASDSVYCIQTGTVMYASTEQGIRVGDPGIVYFHVVPDRSVQPESLVVVGQYLGILQPLAGSTDHVHLIDGPSGIGTPKNNPLLFLDSFVDTILPIVDSLTFYRQGSNTLVLVDTLTGQVDIAVAGRDSLSPEGTDEEPMPHKLGFRVYNHETDSLVSDKFSDPTIRFTQVASHSGFGTTIHRSVDASHPEYWITNTTIDGAEPANRFWNTRARAGDAWDADSSATRNEDARWPDGWYRVQVLLEDTEGNANTLGGRSADTVFVGNFSPTVQQVVAGTGRSGGTRSGVFYDARWEGGELVVETDEPVRLIQGDTLWVELTFSESLHDTIRVTLEKPCRLRRCGGTAWCTRGTGGWGGIR